jgi:hypothetical protein
LAATILAVNADLVRFDEFFQEDFTGVSQTNSFHGSVIVNYFDLMGVSVDPTKNIFATGD